MHLLSMAHSGSPATEPIGVQFAPSQSEKVYRVSHCSVANGPGYGSWRFPFRGEGSSGRIFLELVLRGKS